ncbi:phosphoglycolate phosphatase [Chlamydia trachomatis]|nr:phosphoglycolate phosphatase [Chlamydia trachomatis]CRH55613.1 phosphoglycolate phosphatase [Chlamydia trachomatis]
MMRYYNIDIDDTIVMGDSYNDLSMYEIGNVGVCPANAEQAIKKASTVVMKQTNKEGAVGYFIEEFLQDPDKYIQMAKEKKNEAKKNLKTVKADNFFNKKEEK